jgi:tripartite-type tricarboxylate transporter receptor subunit TctC
MKPICRPSQLMHAIALCALAWWPALAGAQAFPSKPITIFSPVPPGGPVDWLARTVASKLQERWGQPGLVESRPGAAGWIATQATQKAAPDGHTLLAFAQSAYAMNFFIKGADFQVGSNILALTPAFSAPLVLAVNTVLPVKTARELVTYAKANPGKINMAAVPNSDHWIVTHLFLKDANLDAVVVPYAGAAAMQRSVLANEAQAVFITPLALDPMLKSGKVLGLAVSSAKRFSTMPDLPTMKEAADVDMNALSVFGFFTTFGTPRDVVDKLATEIASIIADPEVRAQIAKQGYEPLTMKPDDWTRAIRADETRARAFVQAAGIKPQ